MWADPVTGAAPLVWDRAVGWYFISLLEVLQLVPESHAGHARLLEYYTTLAAALKTSQDASGGWWLIMSEQYVGDEDNYIESSASAMFVFAWLRGIRLGYLDSADYLEPAQKGYNLLIEDFVSENEDGTANWEGTVSVGSLSSNGSYEVGSAPDHFRYAYTNSRNSTTSASLSRLTTTRASDRSCWLRTSGRLGLRALDSSSSCTLELWTNSNILYKACDVCRLFGRF